MTISRVVKIQSMGKANRVLSVDCSIISQECEFQYGRNRKPAFYERRFAIVGMNMNAGMGLKDFLEGS